MNHSHVVRMACHVGHFQPLVGCSPITPFSLYVRNFSTVPKACLQRLITFEQLHFILSSGNVYGLSFYVVPLLDNALCLAGLTTSNVRQFEPLVGSSPLRAFPRYIRNFSTVSKHCLDFLWLSHKSYLNDTFSDGQERGNPANCN